MNAKGIALAIAWIPILSWGCEIDLNGQWKLDLEHFLSTHTDGSSEQRELWTSAFSRSNPITWVLSNGEGELQQNGNSFKIKYMVAGDCSFTFSVPDIPGSEQSFKLIQKHGLVCFSESGANNFGDCFAHHDA